LFTVLPLVVLVQVQWVGKVFASAYGREERGEKVPLISPDLVLTERIHGFLYPVSQGYAVRIGNQTKERVNHLRRRLLGVQSHLGYHPNVNHAPCAGTWQ
jgi:hypothetical protein